MKKILPIFCLFFSLISYCQEQLNEYKYIIVPKQFDSFKQVNQYQTSTLVKYLFSEKGFNVVYDDELSDELSSNRCLGLLAELIDGSNMFTTKSIIVLKDCNSNEVFRTKEGVSKIKEFKAAYSEAIRDAFSTLSGFNHAYTKQTTQPITISFKNDVKTLDSEKTIQVAADKPVPKMVTPNQMVPNTALSKTQEIGEKTPKVESVLGAVFYAQAIANGYQLVDSTPKIVMYMFQTSQDNIYLGQETVGNSGLIYTKNGQWFFEYYSGDQLMVKSLNIKF
tara:strand:- start:14148 stop:14984 length:837 start_codon:yes stop_codon:yes gene_type:complete